MIKMCDECREFIDSLYPKNREWKDNEIIDVLVYYSSEGYTIKYFLDMVGVFDRNGEHIKTFERYEDFVIHIGADKE